MKELLKLYVSAQKIITEPQYDYIKNDEDLFLYYLAANNEQYNDFVHIENFVKSLNENKQKYLIKRQSEFITYIDNPSEQVQLAAVQHDGFAMKYIIDKGITPSEQVQLAAVKQNGYAIYDCDNPSEQVQLAAVQQKGKAIQYIRKPSKQVQIAAVKQDGAAIEYIGNLHPSVINYLNSIKK